MVSLVEVSKSLKRNIALATAASGVTAGGVYHGRKVADSYDADKARGAYKADKRLQREVATGGEGRKRPSSRAFDTLNPSVNRWQDKFQNAEGIRTASKKKLSVADHWLRPKKSVANSDRKILEQYAGSSRERKLKRGMALRERDSGVGTELRHEGMSSWTHRQSGLPDQYAGHAAVRAKVPGSKWSRDNPGAVKPRVVTGIGRAGDITNYSDIYRKANRGRGYRSRELIAEPGVVGRVSRKAKPFDVSNWRKGLSAGGE